MLGTGLDNATHFIVDSSPGSGEPNSDVDMIHSNKRYEEDIDGEEAGTMNLWGERPQ